MVGLVTAIAFLLDGLLSPPLRYHLFVSGLAFVLTVILAVFRGDIAVETGPTTPVAISSLVIAGLFLVVIATARRVKAVADATGKVLNPRRVQAEIFRRLSAYQEAQRDRDRDKRWQDLPQWFAVYEETYNR
jgi:hypothetical protein